MTRVRQVLVLLVLLGLGAAVAFGVNSALGLSFPPVAVPTERLDVAPPRADLPPLPITAVIAPADPRITAAAHAVADAYTARGLRAPAVTTTEHPGPVLRVLTGTAATETFRLVRNGSGLVVRADGVAGAVSALYTVADRVRSGAAVLPTGEDGVAQAPRLGLRLTDLGSVGIDANPAAFTASDDYSLASSPLRDAIRPGPPYLDPGAVARLAGQFRQLVDHDLAQGYNGVIVPGFLEYLTFDALGQQVYPAGDEHRARALAVRAALGPVWRYAHDRGMKVYFGTDMLTVTPPLRRYLDGTGLAVDDPAFWRVYQAGLAELFTALPYVDGLVLRIGEGGDAYHVPGQDVTSQLAVTTVPAVRTMLRALLATAGGANRDVVFRTWTIGVGAVGDLHTNPDSYRAVFGDLHDPHLVVSTKYSAGDFYSHLPLNPTLAVGDQRRIIEFQSRREFEGLGALPDDVGALHQLALRRFLAANPHVEGIWSWTQEGGPLHAGPMELHLRAGFWQLADLNTYLTARLARDPDTDLAAATADWVHQTFSADPATGAVLARVLALSRSAVTEGLYIGPYADHSVTALGLAPPPMMWIFEWDIVTGDSAVLDSIYAVSRGQVDDAVAEGARAVGTARQMRALIGGTDPARWRDPALRQRFLATADYEVSLLDTLGAYRETVLRHAQWLDTGDACAHDAWQAAAQRYRSARAEHQRRYTGDVDLPAYNFTAADLGGARADRDELMAWLARGLLAALAAGVLLGRRSTVGRALVTGALRPWRLRRPGAPTPTRRDRVLVLLVPAVAVVASRAVFTWFAAPAHLVLVLGAWLLYALVLRLLVGRADPFAVCAALGGAALLRTVLLLAALVLRGPGGYWFGFWTDPVARSVYLTVAFAAFLWVFVACGIAVRGRGGTGRVLIAAGVPLLAGGALVAAVGLEDALTVWNDQLALLPWGLHRILGITVYLGIPAWLPLVAAGFGVLLAGAGTVLTRLAPRG